MMGGTQKLARAADGVIWMVAGLPVDLKKLPLAWLDWDSEVAVSATGTVPIASAKEVPMRATPMGPVDTTLCQTSFGWVGIAWSKRGLVALTLPQATEADVLEQLPARTGSVPERMPGLDVPALVDKLRRYFEGEPVAFDEPLDPTIGTEFQQRVWAITRAIPRGQTSSYGQVASQAGSCAARAVGQAMARNPWPIIVPCHRVVGSDGSLTGFGGGLEMKRRMLDMEGAE